jgi:hypothetical protein
MPATQKSGYGSDVLIIDPRSKDWSRPREIVVEENAVCNDSWLDLSNA